MKMDTKLKSKVTSFMTLGTNPEDYSINTTQCFTNASHCDLCGSALKYSAQLIHKTSSPENSSKNLLVGFDCLDNYCETYLPLRKEQVKAKMSSLLEGTRTSHFLNENPKILATAVQVETYFNKTLFDIARENDLINSYWHFVRSNVCSNIRKDAKEVRRKNYLSQPRTDKLNLVRKLMDTDEFLNILKGISETRTKKIQDVIDEDPAFYSLLLEKRSHMNRETANAYTIFEKQAFIKINGPKEMNFIVIPGVY
jgi:hypothetical protein